MAKLKAGCSNKTKITARSTITHGAQEQSLRPPPLSTDVLLLAGCFFLNVEERVNPLRQIKPSGSNHQRAKPRVLAAALLCHRPNFEQPALPSLAGPPLLSRWPVAWSCPISSSRQNRRGSMMHESLSAARCFPLNISGWARRGSKRIANENLKGGLRRRLMAQSKARSGGVKIPD